MHSQSICGVNQEASKIRLMSPRPIVRLRFRVADSDIRTGRVAGRLEWPGLRGRDYTAIRVARKDTGMTPPKLVEFSCEGTSK